MTLALRPKLGVQLVILASLLFLTACGGPMYESNLVGFDAGKRTMKMNYRINEAQFEDGSSGYRLDSENLHAIGNMSRRKTTRRAFLGKDFELRVSETTRIIDAQVIYIKSEVKNGQISISQTVDQQPATTKQLSHQGHVYADLPPILYARDLTNPGDEKHYAVLIESDAVIVNELVRFLGPETIFDNGREIETLHYEIQAPTDPVEFDQYFLDPNNKKIIKIQFGQIKFVPESWVD